MKGWIENEILACVNLQNDWLEDHSNEKNINHK